MTAAGEIAEQIQLRAAALVHDAASQGYIVTIERESLWPPAMGYTQAIISVRLAREMAPETARYLWEAVKEERSKYAEFRVCQQFMGVPEGGLP